MVLDDFKYVMPCLMAGPKADTRANIVGLLESHLADPQLVTPTKVNVPSILATSGPTESPLQPPEKSFSFGR